MSYDTTKRALDIGTAVTCLVLAVPLMAAIALAIRLSDNGPLLYRGRRAGLNGRPFHMLKFRTMRVDAEQTGGSSAGDDDARITRIGLLLRRYKLDELPQLLNVLRGEMSLVGPRPQVLDEVATYSAEERALLGVKPGITDFASLAFRDEGAILRGLPDPDLGYRTLIRPRKMKLALTYVRKRSLRVDLAILWATVQTLVLRRAPLTVANERMT